MYSCSPMDEDLALVSRSARLRSRVGQRVSWPQRSTTQRRHAPCACAQHRRNAPGRCTYHQLMRQAAPVGPPPALPHRMVPSLPPVGAASRTPQIAQIAQKSLLICRGIASSSSTRPAECGHHAGHCSALHGRLAPAGAVWPWLQAATAVAVATAHSSRSYLALQHDQSASS